MSNGAGKGSIYRPVNKKLYDKNYERIFGAKKDEEKKEDYVHGSSEAGNA